MKVIDMRFRPPYKSFLNSLYPNMSGMMKMAQLRQVSVAESAQKQSMELLIKEMDEVEAIGVAPIRKVANCVNDDLFSLHEEYPNHFIGIADIDPLNTEEALAEIDKYVINGPAKGVIIEHAWETNKEYWYVNDERAFAVYEKLQENNIPALFTYGGRRVANQEYYNPRYVDDLAKNFPNLKIVMCHGAWPYVTQACHVATNRNNVYISPDVYMMKFIAGYQDYVTAANYQLQDKILFGTAYPVMSLKDGIAGYKSMLAPEVVDKVLYKNALKVFGMEE